MNKLFKVASLVALTGLIAACQTEERVADYQVIPLPQQIALSTNAPFVLNEGMNILYPEGNEAMKKNAEYLASYIKKATGKQLLVVAGTEGEGAILLQMKLRIDNPEGYELEVTDKGITITASSETGIFYGIQTLRKSIPVAHGATISLPAVKIMDMPRFKYRGVHLDVARHFFSVEEVKSFIDMMALHNMNQLHWHLTEDQGWRLEIKKYPKLTSIGSKRSETVIGKNTGKYNGTPHEGFYTQEEAKEVVAYAAERYINVIPEIDLPGHMQAALAAYPHLGCTGGPYEVWKKWGISDNVLCAGNDSTQIFIEDVLKEVINIFPSQYIHIGGDECPKTQWAKCPKCQAQIRKLGLKSDKHHSKEERLQSFVINNSENFLNKIGRQIIGWDEILEGGLAPNATVMSWRGEKGGIEAAKQKHDVIMTPNTYLYFDYYQTKDTKNEPLAIGGYLPVQTVYNYEPMPASLTAEEQGRILGVQANHWTEYMPTYAQVEYMALPRWAALAEVQWSYAKKDYNNFLGRLPRLMNIYDSEGYNYAKHLFDVEAELTPNAKEGVLEVKLSTLDEAPIHYTLDGTEPTAEAAVYGGVLKIKEDGVLQAVAIRPAGNSRIVSEKIALSLSSLKPIVANQPVNKQYKFKGETTLVDGLKGNKNFKTGRWIAFYKNDMDVTIDLLKLTSVSKVSISVCVEKGDWVFDARAFAVEGSEDGKVFTPIASEEYPAMAKNDPNGIYAHQLTFDPIQTRYIKVIAKTEQEIPAWHGGKGSDAFLFVDEITVE